MPNLSVRRVDEETIRGLRLRASNHGNSMEEEVRQILKQAVSRPEKVGDLAMSLLSSIDDAGEFVLPDRQFHNPIKF